MRKNRTKHEAKKPRLAKRALALCFALIFVCSCLLPAFANSEAGALTDPLTMVEEQDEQKLEDSAPLNEGGTDSTEGNEEQDEQKQEEANASKETSKELTSSSSGEASGESQSTAPSESASSEGSASTAPGESASSSSASSEASGEPEQPASSEPKTEQPASSEQPANSETKTEETKPEEPKQPTTNTTGDTIEQGKATYTYRFWPDKIDAFKLEAINDAVKKDGTSLNDAAQSQAGMVPCTVLTVMTNANLRDYQANVQQPTKDGYEFAGWYTVDGTTEDEFSFEQSLNFEKSKTIDVFAKWNELKAVKSDALSNDGMTVEAKVGPMANVKSVALAEPSQNDAETLRNSIDKQLYDQSYMVAIFDITPKDKDGMDVEPQNGESVNVEISGLDFSAGDNVWVYHLTNSGRVETLSATVTSDGGVAFAAKSFSPFAVVKLTEDMAAFGTGDDRLATADLNEYNRTMTVGDTETLTGRGLLGTHSWRNNNTDAVTVRGNSSSATVTVEAISAGSAGEPVTAIVTHNYDGLVFHYVDRFNITVNEVTSSYPLYVYVKMDTDVQKQLEKAQALDLNKDGWFTLGKVDDVQGLCDPKTYNGGNAPDPKLQDKYSMYQKAVASLSTTSFHRYGQNTQVELEYVKWNYHDVGKEQFGLVTAKGATDYSETYDYQRTWHLDGYIAELSAVVVHYYIKDGQGNLTEIHEPSKHLGTPGKPFTLADDENLESIGEYKRVRMDSNTNVWEFPANGKVKNINLYYGIDIQITKNLTTHDSSKKFTFKVTGEDLGNEDKRTLVDENGIKLERVKGFEMTDQKTVTLKNVEAGMHVNVTEFDQYDYEVTATNYSTPATPNAGGEKTFNYEVELRNGELVLVDSTTKRVVENNHIVVTNTPATTSLTVTKATKKDGADDYSNTKDFEFTLTLGDNSKGVTWKKGTTESGSVDGKSYGFKLKGGESITFSGINVNDNVTVTENDYASQHYTTTVDGTPGREKTIESATLKYNQTTGETVAFVNEYTTPKLNSMTIQKKVTGAFGERTKDFTFNVKLTDANNLTVRGVNHSFSNPATTGALTNFKLKHGEYVTLEEIPIDTTITITESNANDYKTSATGHNQSVTGSNTRTFTYEVVEKDGKAVLVSVGTGAAEVANSAITVTNDFDGNPDTGVLLDTLPYLILLAVAVAGGVLVVVRKRKHRDE